jgi:hypothetical protein
MEPLDVSSVALARAALILGRVALQTLADLNPEAAAAVDDALRHEAGVLGRDGEASSPGVRALIEDLRARLAETAGHVPGEESTWYID